MQLVLNREVWRHSYGRKLYRARLEKFEISLPVKKDSAIDEPGIASWLRVSPFWNSVGEMLKDGLPHVRQATLALLGDSGG